MKEIIFFSAQYKIIQPDYPNTATLAPHAGGASHEIENDKKNKNNPINFPKRNYQSKTKNS